MTRQRILLLGGIALVVLIAAGWAIHLRGNTLVLTGIVTTDDVIVSPMVGGQVQQLLVHEGDSLAPMQLVARIMPSELEADRAYYMHSAEDGVVRVAESESSLQLQREQTDDAIAQADATLATAVAQQAEAVANQSNAKVTVDRYEGLARNGTVSQQDLDQRRTAYTVAQARVEAANKQVAAQQAALAMARGATEQVAIKRSQLHAAEQQQQAADAQRTKADVRLSYTEVRSPMAGIVDVRAVHQGEVVNAGQPIITVINPDSLWVRADVEETYIDRVRVGDSLTVRLPSGDTRRGRVFYRGVDADFATQRDVSRSKRDIKTFEIRLRIDNHDRRLAAGMTAYVLLPANAGA
jgi:HlyD family secretion protein